jgi:multisubunit Na+/H+ antiporter MnhF subunit
VNAWLVAACVLLPLGLGPCAWVACRGEATQRLIALTLAATLISAAFLLVGQGLNRSSYTDVALILVVLAPAGTLVFARFVGGDDPLAAARRSPEAAGDEET